MADLPNLSILLSDRDKERYRLIEIAGQGAHSVVYRAADASSGRTVAMRIPRADIPAEDAARVHRHELAAGKHEGWRSLAVAQVLDETTTADGRAALITEWIDGKTLSGYLKERGPMSLSSLLLLFGPLANALDKAHTAGLRHGDLKPSNLMISAGDAPRAVLIDFGLAQDSNADATMTTAVRGTPRYLAPEIIAGKPTDHRADLYAFACILYECLVGQAPFTQQDTPALLYAHAHTPATPPSEILPSLSSGIDTVFTNALAKEPSQRFASATQLLDAIFVATAQSSQRIGSPPPRKTKWGWLAVPVLGVMGLVAWLSTSNPNRFAPASAAAPTPPVAPSAQPTSEPTPIESPIPNPQSPSSNLLYTPATASGNMPLLVGDALYVSDGQGRISRVDASSGDAGWQVALNPPLNDAVFVFGESLVAANSSGQVQSWSTERGVPNWTLTTDYANQTFVMNDRLIVARWEDLLAIDPNTGRITAIYTRTNEAGWATEFRSLGDRALVGAWNGTLQEFKLGDSGFEVITRVKDVDTSNLTAPPIEAEGLIAVTYKRGVIRVWNADGTEKWAKDLGEAMSAPPLIVRSNPSQTLLIVGVEDGTLRAFDVETQEQVWQYTFGAAVRLAPMLWPDEGVIVGASNGEVALLDLGSGEEKQTWTVQGSVRAPAVIDTENKRAFVRANGVWVLVRTP